ncbi:copper chaperone PCu(A)C [Pseudoalteromonas sp.]|uniref:copper chaperone PCu(A)C n=1 Tax=Pseudoalteromonas sp. TaxID=53249 RepID=UPI003568AC01
MTKVCFSLASAFIMSVFSSSLLAHSGHEHDSNVAALEVHNAQVREFLPTAKSSVAYLTLVNHSDTDTVLTKASIDGLARVEIHQHTHVDGMMKMQQVASLPIAAHQHVDFKPGGYHLMVFEPIEPLKVGQHRKLTLYFSDGNRVFTNAEVVSLASQAEQSNASKSHNHH